MHQSLPDSPLPLFTFSLGHCLSLHTFSPFYWFTFCDFTQRGMLGCDEGLGVRGGERESRAERRYLFSQTERLCPGMSRWWIWLALGWHRHIRRKARTPQHSPLLSHLSPSFPESLLLTLSLRSLSTSTAPRLISTTCPHLSACRRGNNMGLVVWPSSRGVDEVHNQGNKHFILPLRTSDLM